MKKGLIRIVTGLVFLFVQIIVLVWGEPSAVAPTESIVYSVAFYLGYYSCGICGILLLYYGSRAYKSGDTAKLVLHTDLKKIHSIVKYTILVLTVLVYFFRIRDGWEISLAQILQIVGEVFLLVYLLAFYGKKPSFVLSASLIFVGSSYLYGTISNISYYILEIYGNTETLFVIVLDIITSIAAGVLLVVVGVMLYGEKFEVKRIKVIGWAIFVLLLYNHILSFVISYGAGGYLIYRVLRYMLYPIAVLLYTTIFEVNTLAVRKGIETVTTMPCRTEQLERNTVVEYEKAEHTSEQQAAIYCRKCGEKLLADSMFCYKCGTKVEHI